MYRILFLFLVMLAVHGCSSQKELAYLSNLPEDDGKEFFSLDIPDYRIQYRDILYITAKAMASDGMITDFLSPSGNVSGANYLQGESGQYMFGYDVDIRGRINIPVIGELTVFGLTLDSARLIIQYAVDSIFNNATVECKLLSFKYTVLGEVKSPGTYINYNNYLTILEAIGRAGGISDFGNRDRILVIRPDKSGTQTYRISLRDKTILSSEAYFLLPNDVVIVEPESKKIFNLNLPVFTFILTATTSVITSTLLLINYFGKN